LGPERSGRDIDIIVEKYLIICYTYVYYLFRHGNSDYAAVLTPFHSQITEASGLSASITIRYAAARPA
jgi:hypothetical protein